MDAEPVVYAVDDDPLMLRIVQSVLSVAGFEMQTFNSGQSFLEAYDPERPGCLVLEVNMPAMNGLELQVALAKAGSQLPIHFLTGYGDVDLCARAFRSGAFDFLQKPVDQAVLLRQVRSAVEADIARRQQTASTTAHHISRLALTPRETEVMELLVAGKTLKQIAAELQITIQTAAKHRARVLGKFGVENDVALVRMMLDPPEMESA